MGRRAAGSDPVEGRPRGLPRGTVTLLFTDIVGSTRLIATVGRSYADLLERHRATVRAALAAHRGIEVDTEGDGSFAAFDRATDAVAAAEAIQAAHRDGPVRVRIGVHTGEPEPTGTGYVGLDVHRAARICAAGHAGQTLLSRTTRELVDVEARDLGEYRLKDFPEPIRLFQLGTEQPQAPRAPSTVRLPTAPTAIVGRDRELGAVRDMLRDASLITLTGPGGSGKTRLAIEVAREAAPEFADGVFFVDLAPVRDAAFAPASIAAVLGVRDQPETSLVDAIATHLGDRSVLLVLDNLEQVLPVGPVLSLLLAGCPRLRVLATSRAPLHVRGEREFPVEPLAAPAGLEASSLGEIAQNPAVALFVARARDVVREFGLTRENVADVVAICRQVDGLPLAIELAAARIRMFSPSSLRARLERRLATLTSGAADLPPRQQTLRATIAWSAELLSEADRIFFARLSVFAGGFSLPAVESVVTDGGDAPPLDDPVATIEALVDRNLVRVVAGPDDHPRFGMLETVREFAAESLSPGEARAVRDRHLAYFIEFAEAQEALERGTDQRGWIRRVTAERFNVRAALAHAAAIGDADSLLRLAAALERRFWLASGDISLEEQRRWLAAGLDGARVAGPRLRAKALQRGAWTPSASMAQQADALMLSLDAYEEATDHGGMVEVMAGLGTLAMFRGEFDAADEWMVRAHDLAREVDVDAPRLVEVLVARGELAERRGRDREAAVYFNDAVAVARGARDDWGTAFALGRVGQLASKSGNVDLAVDALTESLALSREIDDREEAFEDLFYLARAWLRAEDLGAARSVIAELADDPSAAGRFRALMLLDLLGDWVAAADERSKAALLFGAAAGARRQHYSDLGDWELERAPRITALRDRMPKEDFESAWEQGARMPIAAAVELGLELVSEWTSPVTSDGPEGHARPAR